jgi:hypothetical protein
MPVMDGCWWCPFGVAHREVSRKRPVWAGMFEVRRVAQVSVELGARYSLGRVVVQALIVRRVSVMVVVVVLLVVGWMAVSSRASAASATPVVYVATGDNFPDALGAASAAAVQGGPVLLVQKNSIPAVTAAELSRLSPDVIYVSGGTAVVSDTVFNALKDYAPSVVRVAGGNRYSTAVEVSKSAFPATPSGGGGDTAAFEAAVAALTARLDTLESKVGTLESENAVLQATLAGVSRNGDILLFDGMNLQVVNGQGSTQTQNGLGNVIIGYNEDGTADTGVALRTGSHYLIVGMDNEWTRHGGIVAGLSNTSTGAFASVTGGWLGQAKVAYASVTGGHSNTASANYASVTGGKGNRASGEYSSVSGGWGNTADTTYSSVAGGIGGWISGYASTIVGGDVVDCASDGEVCGEGWLTTPD